MIEVLLCRWIRLCHARPPCSLKADTWKKCRWDRTTPCRSPPPGSLPTRAMYEGCHTNWRRGALTHDQFLTSAKTPWMPWGGWHGRVNIQWLLDERGESWRAIPVGQARWRMRVADVEIAEVFRVDCTAGSANVHAYVQHIRLVA